MPTPDWRYEKSSNTVKALCRLLKTNLDEEQKSEIHAALNDSLKIVCDSVSELDLSRGNIWTPPLVQVFFEQPDKCDLWLELLDDPDFKPDYYASGSK